MTFVSREENYFEMKSSKNNFIFLVQALIILISMKTWSALVTSKNHHASELLNRIFLNNSQSAMKYDSVGQTKMARFLNKIVPNIGNAESVCSSKVLQSNVQSKMRMLRSLISSCPGYCRLAMSQNGILYGSKNEFSLESKLKCFDLFFSNKIKLIKISNFLKLYGEELMQTKLAWQPLILEHSTLNSFNLISFCVLIRMVTYLHW